MAVKVTVTWVDPNPTTYLDHLEVWRDNGAGGVFAKISGNLSLGLQIYEDSSTLNIGSNYRYQVRSYNATNEFSEVQAQITITGGLLLDTYTGSAGAWSLQKLASATTSVMRAYRTSDTTEQDFTADEITNGALASWSAGTDAWVRALYDQSGNGFNLAEATPSLMPKITNNGVVILSNGIPAIDFLTSQRGLRTGSALLSGDLWSMHCAMELTDITSTNQSIINQHSGAANVGRLELLHVQGSVNLKNVGFFNNGSSHSMVATDDWAISQYVVSNYGDGAGEYTFGRNTDTPEVVLTGQTLIPENTPLNLGGQGTTAYSNFFKGKFKELVIWETDQSANRTGIQNNILGRY